VLRIGIRGEVPLGGSVERFGVCQERRQLGGAGRLRPGQPEGTQQQAREHLDERKREHAGARRAFEHGSKERTQPCYLVSSALSSSAANRLCFGSTVGSLQGSDCDAFLRVCSVTETLTVVVVALSLTSVR